eukprot:2623870-Alexandrium_andersonii.AAC.1
MLRCEPGLRPSSSPRGPGPELATPARSWLAGAAVRLRQPWLPSGLRHFAAGLPGHDLWLLPLST